MNAKPTMHCLCCNAEMDAGEPVRTYVDPEHTEGCTSYLFFCYECDAVRTIRVTDTGRAQEQRGSQWLDVAFDESDLPQAGTGNEGDVESTRIFGHYISRKVS